MTAHVVPLGPREHALNAADPSCEACSGTGMRQGQRCGCTLSPPRVLFATYVEALAAADAAGDPWVGPAWTGNGWALRQRRERPLTCPACGHKHHDFDLTCSPCMAKQWDGGGA